MYEAFSYLCMRPESGKINKNKVLTPMVQDMDHPILLVYSNCEVTGFSFCHFFLRCLYYALGILIHSPAEHLIRKRVFVGAA